MYQRNNNNKRFGGNGGGFRGGNRGGNRRKFSSRGPRIDTSRFVNKAVVVAQDEKFVPVHTFSDFAVDLKLKQLIAKKNYVEPTPIQDQSIPHVLNGRDIVGIAETGTGKTAAFLIPLIDKVIKNPKEKVLIIVPTRELAIQIQEELRTLTLGMKVFSVCCVGGVPIGKQIRELRYFNHFIIGTPGRLKDLENKKFINFKEFRTVVLDEADRMLDMGFIGDMRYVMNLMPNDRQTLFFSATMSKEIQALIHDFLTDPVTVSLKTRDTSKSVDQDVVRIAPGQNKIDVLETLLNNDDMSRVIIFGRTKHGVEKLSKALSLKGFKADSIHGNKNHNHRQRALQAFKGDAVKILVATDVAARGLDIPNVSHVINYDIPETYEDYVHRIGRTGRGGKAGKALTFID